MQSSNGWLQGIQYFRAIAVIEVIAGHALLVASWTGASALGPLNRAITGLFAIFVGFGVLHFVFISGVVLYNKYHNGFSLSTFYKRRFSAVLPPYIVWSTFYVFYGYVAALLFSIFHYSAFLFLAYSSIPNVTQLFSDYVKALVTGIHHLWYVLLILQLYLLYPLLVKFYNKWAKQANPVYILSLLALVQVIFTSFFPFVNRENNLFLGELFLGFIFYFVLGFYVAAHYQVIKQKIAKVSLIGLSLAVLVSTICFRVAFGYLSLASLPLYPALRYQTVSLFYCLLLIIFYLRICTALGEPHGFFTSYLEKIGEDSFGIYLIHYFFILVLAAALPKLGLTPYNLLFYPILAFLTLLLSYVSVQLLYRLPFATITIGKRRKRQTSGEPVSTAPVPK
jgi:peptidoglycan/LPS O-acetylase OafA/YrhL